VDKQQQQLEYDPSKSTKSAFSRMKKAIKANVHKWSEDIVTEELLMKSSITYGSKKLMVIKLQIYID